MASPTKEQIIKFEEAHKNMFASLVIANNLWLAMPGQYGFNPKDTTSAKYKAWMAFGASINAKASRWAGIQYKLEAVPNGNVEKLLQYAGNFLQPGAKQKALSNAALKVIKPGTAGTGLGFVPLIIWAVIALIAAFTAVYIVDETTTTAQEQAKLLQDTEKACKALNIPPEKASEIIKETQAQATTDKGLFNNLFGGSSSLLILAAFLLFMNNNKNQK